MMAFTIEVTGKRLAREFTGDVKIEDCCDEPIITILTVLLTKLNEDHHLDSADLIKCTFIRKP